MSARAALLEWIQIHVKNRDMYAKTLKSLEPQEGFDLVAHHEDKDAYYLVRPILSSVDEILSASKGKQINLILANCKKNVDMLAKNWDRLKECKGLCVFFVNPASGEKWMLYPKTHDMITDKNALKPGLYALFEGIEPYESC